MMTQTPLAVHLRAIDAAVIARSARDGYARLQATAAPAVCPTCNSPIQAGAGLPTSIGTYCSQDCLWTGLD